MVSFLASYNNQLFIFKFIASLIVPLIAALIFTLIVLIYSHTPYSRWLYAWMIAFLAAIYIFLVRLNGAVNSVMSKGCISNGLALLYLWVGKMRYAL